MRNYLLILSIFIITGCSSSKTLLEKELNVLFIGNSLTYYHNMPQTLQQMLNETNANIKISQSTYPGYQLSTHLSGNIDSSSEPRIITLTEKKIIEKKWDVIVLQTGTVGILIPKNRVVKVNNAIRRIKEMATNPDCKFILFNTWPSKKEYPKKYCYSSNFISKSLDDDIYCSPDIKNLDQEINLINESHKLVAIENDLVVSNNGSKYYEILTKYPQIELYEDDIHPNEYGSFLNACIFYQILTGKKTSKLNYNGKIEPNKATLLKKIAQ